MKSFAVISALLIPFVAAHGYVPEIKIGGKSYNGPKPGAKSAPNSVIRPVSNVNPSYGVHNKNLICGPDSVPAGKSASAMPGDSIEFTWNEFTDGRVWPHDTGYHVTYMASCGNADCSKFDASNAEWFKIGEVGKVNGVWAQAALHRGEPAKAVIPSKLAPGNYLIMNQLVSLHLADSKGAEFYASCSQLKVGGNQSGAPSKSELVNILQAYTEADNHPSNVYGRGSFKVPGPTISKLAATSNDTPSNDSPSASEPAAPSDPTEPTSPETPSETASPSTPTKSNGSCKKSSNKKEASGANGNNSTTPNYKPRHVSRVMRAVAHEISGSFH